MSNISLTGADAPWSPPERVSLWPPAMILLAVMAGVVFLVWAAGHRLQWVTPLLAAQH